MSHPSLSPGIAHHYRQDLYAAADAHRRATGAGQSHRGTARPDRGAVSAARLAPLTGFRALLRVTLLRHGH